MRAERKKIARWAILAKEPDCRAGGASENDPVDHFCEEPECSRGNSAIRMRQVNRVVKENISRLKKQR